MPKLPKPDEYRRYKLPCGSIIYPSGNDFKRDGIRVEMPDRNKWLLWIKDGDQPSSAGVPIAFGHFVMDTKGPMYFKTPIAAYCHLEELQGCTP